MPEGPEVRVVADRLGPLLVGRRILRVDCTTRAKLTNFELLPPDCLITRVWSYAKKLIWELDGGGSIMISLMMTGRLCWQPGPHTHLAFQLGTVRETRPRLRLFLSTLYFNDTRYMGRLLYCPDAQALNQQLAKIGPDILATEVSSTDWLAIFRPANSRGTTKVSTFLLDSSRIGGIGNYLKSEILYRAGICPERKVGSLTEVELERLRVAAHATIRESYSYGGLTISDFWDPDGRPGTFPVQVYRQDYDPRGRKVMATKEARTTYWVPEAQV